MAGRFESLGGIHVHDRHGRAHVNDAARTAACSEVDTHEDGRIPEPRAHVVRRSYANPWTARKANYSGAVVDRGH